MYKAICFIIFTCLAISLPTFADDGSSAPAYSFKVYADDYLFWEGRLDSGKEIATKELGLPGTAQCYHPKVEKLYASVFCKPTLRIMRGEKAKLSANDSNCDGFVLVEDYLDHWEMNKSKGIISLVPINVVHHMCVGNEDNINFTEKTGEGWLKQTTYRIEMLKE